MSYMDYVYIPDEEDRTTNMAVTCTSLNDCPYANECIFAAEKNGVEKDLKGTGWCTHFINRYTKIVNMGAEEFAQFLDSLTGGTFNQDAPWDAPWDTWVEKNFCKNCKPVVVKNEAGEDVEMQFCEAVGEKLLNRAQCPFSGYEGNIYSIVKWLEEIEPIEDIEKEFSV